MWPSFERWHGSLTTILGELEQTLRQIGSAAQDRRLLPLEVARTLDADWIAFRERGGEWICGDRDGVHDRVRSERVTRQIDFAGISRLPGAGLHRLAGSALERSPRFSSAGIREVLIYTDPAPGRSPGLAVIALSRPLAVAHDVVEAVLRVWSALPDLRARVERAEELDRRAELGTRAACTLHDLRHELTVSSLELDRLSTESDPLDTGRLERVRTAIATARALCGAVGETESRAPAQPMPILVAGLLRMEVNAARSVAGRDDSILIQFRCREDLEFPVDGPVLSRITRNLVLNAIEASPDGEHVSIEADLGPESELVLRVIDHGRGMSIADQEDLSRFGRSGRGGWGLGSASIEDCSRRLGAKRSVDSRPGYGTCVELRIPRAGGTREFRSADPRNESRRGGTHG